MDTRPSTSCPSCAPFAAARTASASRNVRSPAELSLDRDRARRTAADGGLDLGAQCFGRLLLQDVEEVVLADLEDLRCSDLTDRIAVALVEIHDDLHDSRPPLVAID